MELTLQTYEEEVLMAMYDEGIIGNAYRSVQIIRSKIRWEEIARRHKVNKSFDNVIRHLANKGYVDFHGKSGDVASLSRLGVSYVWQKKKESGRI